MKRALSHSELIRKAGKLASRHAAKLARRPDSATLTWLLRQYLAKLQRVQKDYEDKRGSKAA